MVTAEIRPNYRYAYGGKTYNVLAVLPETLIQYADEWWPVVRYTTDGTDKAFVRSTKEFDEKFYPLDEAILHDGRYRPFMCLDGSNFWLVRYTRLPDEVSVQAFMEKKGRRLKFETYAEAKAFGDKVNAGFLR